MPKEKEMFNTIYHMTEGYLIGAKQKVSDLEGFAIKHTRSKKGKLNEDQLMNIHHCIHWYLIANDTAKIDMVSAGETGEKTEYHLKDPRENYGKRKLENIANSIIKDNTLWLESRYGKIMEEN